jgi:ATP-dependent Zn protease
MAEEGEKDSSNIADQEYESVIELTRAIDQHLVEIKDLLYNKKPQSANPEYLREVLSSIVNIHSVVSKAIDARENALENIETEDEEHRVQENLRPLAQNLNDVLMETSMGIFEITKWFTYQKQNDLDWKQEIRLLNDSRSTEITLADSLSHKPFEGSYWGTDNLREMNSNDIQKKEQLPSQHLFIELQLLNSIAHLHGVLHSIMFYNVTDNGLDIEEVLQPTSDIENLHQFGELLLSRTHLFSSRPFDVPEDKSDELNDLLSELIFTQRAVLDMFEKLKIGSGPYEPVLSNSDHHMVTNKKERRIPYSNLPMWPIKTKRWESLRSLDVVNWLGRDYHVEKVHGGEESHNVVYRDFINFIQSLGFVHKKVTAYMDEKRLQPQLVSFEWGGAKKKYRPNASIYFYNPLCPISDREMRISIDSSAETNSITVNVGLEFCKPDSSIGDVSKDEIPMIARELTEKYCAELMDLFEAYQKKNGLLKNAKFNAHTMELKLKGRTFEDLLLSPPKKQLLDDNIFALLRYADAITERGVETNRGIMLAGPPGVGKSLTLDAIIHEGNCTVLFADFDMLHKAMDMIFRLARKYAPTILILEDIDALGITGQRGVTSGGAGLSTLLNNMDGINSNNGVITVATSNHPESLDWALIARPGRFDVRIDYEYPDHDLLMGIFELKLKPYPKKDGLDIYSIVKRMPHGFTGSHIQDIVNQANYISINQSNGDEDEGHISQEHLELAFERSLYNFNKFLKERPHIQLKKREDAGQIISRSSDDFDDVLFG